MLDKTDLKLLSLLQQDCTLSLQALADAVNLTTTPCWKRLKKLEDDGIIRARVALLDGDKIGLSLTAFMFVKTQQHSRDWYQAFVSVVSSMPEVMAFYRMAGEYDYLLRIQVADLAHFSRFAMDTLMRHPAVVDMRSFFALQQIKETTELRL